MRALWKHLMCDLLSRHSMEYIGPSDVPVPSYERAEDWKCVRCPQRVTYVYFTEF